MTNEEALKILDTIPTISEQVDALEMAIKALEQTKWIPVSERLPEDHENVLIWLKSNHITIGLYNSHKLPCDDRPIGWGVDAEISAHNFRSDDVLAWLPLPEPYKAEIGQALADTPTAKAVPIKKINNLINDIEVLRTDPVIIDNDDVQRFAENVLYALNNLIKEGK